MSIFSKLFGKKERDVGLMSFGDYAERYASVVRAAHPRVVVKVEHAGSAALTRVFWTAEDDFKANQFMGNWHGRYLQQPDRLKELLAKQLDEAHAVQASSARSSLGLGCILPVIKTFDWRQATAAQLDAAKVPHESRPLSLPLVGDLMVAYVEDTPTAMSYIAASRLESLGLDMPALQALALENLARRLPELQVKGGGGRYAARLDRNYDASMVLLFSQWRNQIEVAGDPVLVIAARDDLLICGSEDIDSLTSLRAMAAEVKVNSPYSLSEQLFVWRDGRLQDYVEG